MNLDADAGSGWKNKPGAINELDFHNEQFFEYVAMPPTLRASG